MSLPKPNTAWPPPVLQKVTERTNESHVWWEGDIVKLNEFYSAEQGAQRTSSRNRLRDAYDAFWGKPPTTTTQPIKRRHAPVAGVISKLSAKELFNEPPRFLAPTGSEKKQAKITSPLQKRTDEIFNKPQFHSKLMGGGETCAALGNSYQRVVWDPAIADNAFLDFVDADCAIPEFRWGQLIGINFWSELESDDPRVVWRHFERHEPGYIVHAVYMGTPTSVGRMMALVDHEDTADIVVDGTDDRGSFTETGVKELTAAYVPNVTPNPEWRSDPRLKDLGRADISTDAIPVLHDIDRVYSSLMKDFRIGTGRVYASENVLTSMGRGKGMGLSEDQEVFTQVGSAMGKDGSMESIFQFFQPEIRVLAHDQGGEILLRKILMKTGYSPVSLGLSDEVAQTATEASGKKKATIDTTTAKARHWGAALGPLATTLLRVDAIKFPGKGVAPTEDLDIEWPKFARESDEAKSRTVQGWSAAGAASTRSMVAYIHDDWDDEQIDEEVALIDKAAELAVPDFGGGFGGDNPPLPNEKPADDAKPVEDKPAEGNPFAK